MATVFGEITMAVAVKSEMELNQLKSYLEADGLRADLNLKLLDGSSVKADVQDVFSTDFEDINDLSK